MVKSNYQVIHLSGNVFLVTLMIATLNDAPIRPLPHSQGLVVGMTGPCDRTKAPDNLNVTNAISPPNLGFIWSAYGAPCGAPSRAPCGELHMELHVELHMEFHMELSRGLHVEEDSAPYGTPHGVPSSTCGFV